MNRKTYVDFAKCIAILFVLMNHIGLTIPYVSNFGGMFYVPIFFVLAGYTYHTKEESYISFIRKKAKRLLVPYFVANFVYFVFFFIKDDIFGNRVGVQSLKPLGGIIYSRFSLYPLEEEFAEANIYFLTIQNSPTWFLTALFLSYLLFEVVVRVANSNKKKHRGNSVLAIASVVLLAVGMIFHYVCPILLPWSVDCVPFFTVYMIAGYYVANKNFLEGIEEKKGILPYIVFIILVAVTIGGYYFGGSANISVGNFGRYTLLGVWNGIVSSLLVLYLCFGSKNFLPKVLCEIGRNTLHILCYHLFVFMFLITLCNVLLPGVLEQTTGMSYMLKFVVVFVTIGVIMLGAKCRLLFALLYKSGKKT